MKMKRDMDLIRKILFIVEQKKPFEVICNLSIEGYDIQEIAYHCEMMYQAGLIKYYYGEGCDNYDGVLSFQVQDLTWEGHDLLGTIRQDTIWNKTKKTLADKGIALTIGTVKTIATAFITATVEGVASAIIKNGGQT